MTIHNAYDGVSPGAEVMLPVQPLATLEAADGGVESIVEALARHARRRPEHTALVTSEGTLSYGELWKRAAAAASYMLDRGILRGDRVLLSSQRASAFAIGYFATHLAGAISVPVDSEASASALSDLVRRVEPKLIIGGAELGRVRALALPSEELDDLPAPTQFIGLPDGDDPADVVFTRGTTGRPKPLLFTQDRLRSAAERTNCLLGNHQGDVEVAALSLAHPAGLARLRCTVLAGGTLIPSLSANRPSQVFEALHRYRATGLSGVPASFASLLRFGDTALGGPHMSVFANLLRYVAVSGDPMRLEHKLRLVELLPRTGVWMDYGSTEAPSCAFLEFHRHKERLHTVGRPARGVEIRIADERGRELAAGKPGLVWVKGPATASAYFQDPGLTAQRFVAGFVCTGDAGKVDNDGFLHLHGRHHDNLQRSALRAREKEWASTTPSSPRRRGRH